ncbi:MAG TPA: hypothetical protein VIL35_11865 [Vicinamibacterales bacterium]
MKICTFIAALAAFASQPAIAAQPPDQQTAAAEQQEAVGTVVSTTRSTLVVRTDDGQFRLFVLEPDTQRTGTLAAGATVRVTFTPDETGEAPAASAVAVTAPPRAQTTAGRPEDPIPPRVRQLERQIERTARRYRAGVRGGVGLDPELVTVGAHATLGPLFTNRLYARPNVEFAYGELTTLFAVNLEAIYRLTPRLSRTRWSPYVGGGPALGFTHRGFEGTDDGRSFDFDDLSFNGGLNLIGGVEKASGAFMELKATIYADPTFRFLVGYTF